MTERRVEDGVERKMTYKRGAGRLDGREKRSEEMLVGKKKRDTRRGAHKWQSERRGTDGGTRLPRCPHRRPCLRTGEGRSRSGEGGSGILVEQHVRHTFLFEVGIIHPVLHSERPALEVPHSLEVRERSAREWEV